MMRSISSGLRALALCVLGGAFCEAGVIQYSLAFGAANDGGAAPTGSFSYNTATNLFESFDVTFRGIAVNLLDGANSPVFLNVGTAPCLSGATGAQASFAAMTGNCGPLTWRAQESSSSLFFLISTGEINPEPLPGFVQIIGTGTLPPGVTVISSITKIASGRPVTATQVGMSEVPEPSLALPLVVLLGVVARQYRMRKEQEHQ